jgi:ketosteroid isomerase-like protein
MPREIRVFFETYRDAFNALDGTAVAELYAEPSGIAQDAKYTHWANRRLIAENMSALCQIYKDKGFIRTDFEPSQFIEQGSHHAVADVVWRIEWDNDQQPWCFKTTYNLVRTGQGWRVLLCTAYSEATLHEAASAAQHLAQPDSSPQRAG